MSDTVSFALKSALGQMMPSLIHILKAGQAHAKAIEVDESVLLNHRLAPDMLPLTSQVQIASDISVRATARLAGVEPPSFPDTEISFAQLVERVEKAQQYAMGLPDDQLNASAGTDITFPVGGDNTMTLPGQSFLMSFLLPNLYFHVTTTYALLRSQGVALGKRDYLMGGGS